ncbi:hypothetical protein V5O48_018237 [Marasmius crinis-equi]|uniref:Aminotransferase class I/classII domain-containing protein n=1 Tax=Marasmius crinis-equi TaxID=585013 RepID=A0ABR3ELQ8_9AGAR
MRHHWLDLFIPTRSMFVLKQCADIATDASGIIPSSLESVLETWTDSRSTARPRLLYVIPFGVGPETTRERRKEILRIVRKWGVVILEDDPYYYISSSSKRAEYPSYFALEREEEEVGHVLRYDTLSKIVAPGLSIGWMSGPEVLVNAVDTYTSTANLQAATVNQAVALALLSTWGHDGFLKHVESVYEFYSRA